MCGIVGYIGKRRKVEFLVEKLKILEYRGYDSAGFATLDQNGISITKRKGDILSLKKEVSQNIETNCAIAHTRWATHGEPNKLNAHPHASHSGKWVLVHNGIIENYKELKNHIKNLPQSTTDTAVLAEFLEEKGAENIFDFIDVFKNIEGSFGIAALCKTKPNEMFLAKNKSPLYVSKNSQNEFLVASDPMCFSEFSSTYFSLSDGEFAHIKNDKIIFYNVTKKQVEKKEKVLDVATQNVGIGNYPHFMLKEIMEEPAVLKNQIKIFKEKNIFDVFEEGFIQKFESVKFIGCGTAFNAGLVGAKYFQKILGVCASAEIASEFICSEPVFASPKTLFVFVSQSGETADTLSALGLAKSKGAFCVVLTNVMHSSMASKADIVIPVCAGPEIAVASTKAYVCQLSALYVFANVLFSKHLFLGAVEEIENVANEILNFNKEKIDDLAKWLSSKKEAIFIGKDIDSISSAEASLKLKEVAYILSEHYPSGELKHGFLALVESGTPLIVFAGNKNTNNKTFNSAAEAVSRGAFEILVTNKEISETENRKVVQISCKNPLLFAISSIVPMQYLAYRVSIFKNINPDKPRNLAKSVTVE